MEKTQINFDPLPRIRTEAELRALLDDLMERMLQARERAEVLQVEVHILEWALGAGIVPSSLRAGDQDE